MRRFVARDFDLILALHRPGKVVVHLHAQPGIRGAAESLLEPDGHFRSDARFAIKKVIQGLAAHTENLGSGSDGKSERYQAIVPDNAPRMHRIFHGHEYSPFLMVVHQVDVASSAIFETENNPPVGANREGPVSFPIAFELVQAVAGKIESLRGGSGVQYAQNTLDFVGQVSAKAAAIVLLEQPLQALVLKADDHCESVQRQLSLVNTFTVAGSVLETQSDYPQASVFPVGTLVPQPALWHFNGARISAKRKRNASTSDKFPCDAQCGVKSHDPNYGAPRQNATTAFSWGAKDTARGASDNQLIIRRGLEPRESSRAPLDRSCLLSSSRPTSASSDFSPVRTALLKGQGCGGSRGD